MRNHRIIFVVTAVLTFAGISTAAKAETTTLDHTVEILEKLIDVEMEHGLPSASVALIKGDEVIWTGAYGWANYGLKANVTPETLYATASTLKPVTATAILTLVDQGKINLDDPVNKYLGKHAVSDNPEDSVTVRSILDHTSGLSDDAGQTIYNIWDRFRPRIQSLEEVAVTLPDPGAGGRRISLQQFRLCPRRSGDRKSFRHVL